jgi:hypothetical protein
MHLRGKWHGTRTQEAILPDLVRKEERHTCQVKCDTPWANMIPGRFAPQSAPVSCMYIDVNSHRNCVRRPYLSCASKREDPSVRSKDLIASGLDHRGNTTD